MTVSEFYAAVGGDYEEILGRFRNEERIIKFLRMFLNDPSTSELRSSMAAENYEEAFRAAHTLKGVAANLGFTAMQTAASNVTEALRGENRDGEKAKALMPKLDEICEMTYAALNELLGE